MGGSCEARAMAIRHAAHSVTSDVFDMFVPDHLEHIIFANAPFRYGRLPEVH